MPHNYEIFLLGKNGRDGYIILLILPYHQEIEWADPPPRQKHKSWYAKHKSGYRNPEMIGLYRKMGCTEHK